MSGDFHSHICSPHCLQYAEEKKEGGMKDTLILGALFGGWYLANIYFNM